MDATHHDHHDPSPTPGPHAQPGSHDIPMAEHAGHDRHEGHSVAMFRDRFWLSLLMTITVVVWSMGRGVGRHRAHPR